eukprot:gene29329-17385_t
MARLEQLVAIGVTIASAPPAARMDALMSDESLGILKEMCVSGAFGATIQAAVGAKAVEAIARIVNNEMLRSVRMKTLS